jgi:thiol-disulfide isomerase/thioredoxin
MKNAGRIALFAVVAVSALVAGHWLYPWNGGVTPNTGNVVELMAATLPDMDGKSQALAQWRGKVIVVNFWATWCPPCLEEIPEFVRMQEKLGPRGLQFVGIAIDNRDKAREFAAKFGINYPILIGEMEGIELVRRVGNDRGGLPFTVIVDRKGRLLGTELGGLNEQKLTAIVAPAL